MGDDVILSDFFEIYQLNMPIYNNIIFENYIIENVDNITDTPSTINNPNNLCYLISSLQCLFSLSYFTSKLLEYNGDDRITIIFKDLYKLYMNRTDIRSIIKILASFDRQSTDLQKDANEFLVHYLSILSDTLELHQNSRLMIDYCYGCNYDTSISTDISDVMNIIIDEIEEIYESLVRLFGEDFSIKNNDRFILQNIIEYGSTNIRKFCTEQNHNNANDNKEGAEHARKEYLVGLGPILIINFKLYDHLNRKIVNLNNIVYFTDHLCFKHSEYEYVDSSLNIKYMHYRLYAVSNHIGNGTKGGHYISYVKRKNKYFYISDSVIREINNLPNPYNNLLPDGSNYYTLYYQYEGLIDEETAKTYLKEPGITQPREQVQRLERLKKQKQQQ